MSSVPAPSVCSATLDVLRELDTAGTGTISRSGLVKFLGDVGMNSALIEEAVERFTGNVDGDVNYSEFFKWLLLVPGDSVAVQSSGGTTTVVEDKQQLRAASRNFKVQWAEPVKLDQSLTAKFLALDQSGKVRAEYVWLDEDYKEDTFTAPRGLCSKSMTLDGPVKSVEDLPVWSYSGSEDQDVMLVPRRIYRDPFRPGENILVLADTYVEPEPESGMQYGPPTAFNTRAPCEDTMQRVTCEEPWFGIEQEYFLLDLETGWPLGWPRGGFPGEHDAYYMAVGARKAPGRDVVEAHYSACLYAGVKIGGVNGEVSPGQWEFQVGPLSGVHAADDLWLARYILERICEMFHVDITLDPKPVPGWAGIGCHTNYSTRATRNKPGGLDAMRAQIELLRARHVEHMEVYGEGNELRLTGDGDFCCAGKDEFTFGIGRRDCSIRITSKVAAADCGYFEDRRPAANADPYLVTEMIVATTLHRDSSPRNARRRIGRRGTFYDRQLRCRPSSKPNSRGTPGFGPL